jgi:hypothetical protein
MPLREMMVNSSRKGAKDAKGRSTNQAADGCPLAERERPAQGVVERGGRVDAEQVEGRGSEVGRRNGGVRHFRHEPVGAGGI